ncbi:MAG TPA: hypothetical protein VIT92_09935, partial [Burkholderiaceae bacterium]
MGKRTAGYGIVAIALGAVLLAGCAAQLAYRDGKELIAQDKVAEGLAQLEKAATLEPRNTEYRSAFLQTRDRITAKLLQQGERALAVGNVDEAGKEYGRVLAFDAANERAQAGLKDIADAQRHAAMLKEAGDLEKRDPDAAKAKLAAILVDNPRHDAAR